VDIIVTKEPIYKFVPPGALRNEKYEHFDQKGQLQRRGSKGAGSKIRKDVGNGAVLLVLSGCSSFNIGSDEYGCPGMPSGVQCMSARDVYSATNDGNVPRPMKPEEVKAKAEADGGGSSDVSVSSSNSGDSVIDNYVAPRLPDRPIPFAHLRRLCGFG
jgi:conjugal transfer pilus assembly protein TraV